MTELPKNEWIMQSKNEKIEGRRDEMLYKVKTKLTSNPFSGSQPMWPMCLCKKKKINIIKLKLKLLKKNWNR